MTEVERIFSKRDVVRITSLSSTTLWREWRAGRFPKPQQISKGRVGWPESEIRDWLARKGTSQQ